MGAVAFRTARRGKDAAPSILGQLRSTVESASLGLFGSFNNPSKPVGAASPARGSLLILYSPD